MNQDMLWNGLHQNLTIVLHCLGGHPKIGRHTDLTTFLKLFWGFLFELGLHWVNFEQLILSLPKKDKKFLVSTKTPWLYIFLSFLEVEKYFCLVYQTIRKPIIQTLWNSRGCTLIKSIQFMFHKCSWYLSLLFEILQVIFLYFATNSKWTSL